MLPKFRAKTFTGTDLTDITNNVLPAFSALNAYPDALKVEQALDTFHAQNGKRDTTGLFKSRLSRGMGKSKISSEIANER